MKKINVKKETAIELVKSNLLPFGEEIDFKIAKENATLEIRKQSILYCKYWLDVIDEIDNLKIKDLK